MSMSFAELVEHAHDHKEGPVMCRLILFLQQSSVEWCSSLWMHVIQEVDPHFQRTVGLNAPNAADLYLTVPHCQLLFRP